MPLGYSLDNIGPMARTARDCAIMLQVMAGYDPLDLCSVDVPVPDMLGLIDGSLEGVRDRRAARLLLHRPEPRSRGEGGGRGGLDAMAAAGATVVDVSIPHADAARHAQRITMIERGVRLPRARPAGAAGAVRQVHPPAASRSARSSPLPTTSRPSGSGR